MFELIAVSAMLMGQTDNSLVRELRTKGVQIGPIKYQMAEPILPDNATAKQESEILAKLAGNTPIETFLLKTATAPHSFKIESIPATGSRQGQVVDVAFVVYGSIDTVANTQALEKLLGNSAQKVAPGQGPLTDKQLADRGLKETREKLIEERYVRFELDLLDKVLLQGVTRNVKTLEPERVLLGTMLDTRFATDKEIPNQWRPIDINGGAKKVGPPQPYTGMAGYAQVRKLKSVDGALFVEMHMVLAEPPEWFGGPNLLRSKLNLVIAPKVRAFREALMKKAAN